MTRVGALAVIVLLLFAGPTTSASADPAGPTDYRSEVVAVVPPASGVDIEMIGGDSFLQLSVAAGTTVDVIGYRGELYLRFEPDGTVEINDNAPSTYLSEDRYGETEVPDFATVDAEPEWRVVATNGVYAWHDHRSHWMNDARPAAEPGDQILEAVVPMVVDGNETDVTVISTWVDAPSPLPAAVGAILGGLLALVASRLQDRPAGAVLGMLALSASAVSWVACRSVPPETAPSYVPLVAAVAALALAAYGALQPRGDRALGVIAPAVVLAGWGYLRRDWMSRAILPTSIPTVDRFVTGLVFAAAGIVTLAVIIQLLRVGVAVKRSE